MTASPTSAPDEGSMIVLRPTAEDHRIAGYAAAAIALTIIEAALPSPIPGVKPGLANIIILVVLLRHGWKDAVWVSLLRVVAASLVGGTFLAPGFFMSLAGAIASLGVLGLSCRLPPRWFGPVSHSVLAAFAHVGGQIVVARFWLVPHDGVFYLLPIFGAAALIFGIVNGLVAGHIMKRDAAASDGSIIDGVLPQATTQSAPLARPSCCLVVPGAGVASPAPTGEMELTK
jgi:heptaprenyl diphosphate synthase